ncbi:Uncharacterised protein [Mycoplasmopsis gallinacea]|uniref:Uncharacterized protein n=2 Tax=Mycoplasmopsis gallinacea TaxID=29556 RepID=A0A449A270_9BACT|nr:Uncharacterised protein [Mycoplasmopsis gallinacea]
MKYFIIFLICLFLITLVLLSFLLFRNIYMNKTFNKVTKIKNEINYLISYNLSTLSKYQSIKNENKTFDKTYDDLNSLNQFISSFVTTLKNIFDQIKEHYKNKQIIQFYRKVKEFNYNHNKFKGYNSKFESLTFELNQKWNTFDNDWDRLLDALTETQYFLDSSKEFIPNTYEKAIVLNYEYRSNLTSFKNLRKSGDFKHTNEQMIEFSKQIQQYIQICDSLKKLDWILFVALPSQIKFIKNKSNSYDHKFYDNLSKEVLSLQNEWNELSYNQIIHKIKAIYQLLFEIARENHNKNLVESFNENNAHFLETIIKEIQEDKIDQNVFNELKNIAKSISIAKNYSKTLSLYKEFIDKASNAFQSRQNKEIKRSSYFHKMQAFNIEVLQTISLYKELIEDKNWTSSFKARKIKLELDNFYQENLLKLTKETVINLSENKYKWNNWVDLISQGIKIVSENSAYKKLINELRKVLTDKYQYSSKKSESINEIFTLAQNELKNNDYKMLYRDLKDKLKEKKYV